MGVVDYGIKGAKIATFAINKLSLNCGNIDFYYSSTD